MSADEPKSNGDLSGERRNDGTFRAGNTAAPGRRKGRRNNATIMLEKMLADDGEAVLQAVIEQAKAGDMQAARMVVDRILPARRGARVQIELPAVDNADDISAASEALLTAVANGEISPDEGQTVATIIETRRKAIETADLEARVSALEGKTGG